MGRWLLALVLAWGVVVARAQTTPSSRSRTQKPAEAFYRYKGANGRATYTNAAEQVPLAQRADAAVDLSRVSLNTELGNEIAQRIEREHTALTKTPYCEQARTAAAKPFFEQLWDQYAALVVAAGVLLLLLLVSPAAMRRFGVEGWNKALMLAIPAIFATGLLVFSLDKTRNSMAALQARAEPCAPGALAALGTQDGVLQKHAVLVDRLKRDMAVIDAER